LNIKAQGLLNAAKWVEEQHGSAVLRDILHGCSPAVRDRYIAATAINWHPIEEFVEFVAAAEQRLGSGDGKIAEAIGAAGARSNMKGILTRLALYMASSEYLMKRIAGMWRQFNDEGEMKVLDVTAAKVVLEVVDVPAPTWFFCCTVTGWCREIAAALAVQNGVARHMHCRARGDARCVFEVRGTAGPVRPPMKSNPIG
jgi:hypothetical protein